MLDQIEGNIIGETKAPHRLVALTWDGNYLWATATNYKILKFNRYFHIVAEYPSPGYFPGGIAWDGQHIWTTDTKTVWFYEHDENMNVIRTLCPFYQDIEYTLQNIGGTKYIAFDMNGDLWALGSGGAKAYKLTIP